jgi:murein DD-endopeptidase MepM/ murein hydrolase activator NlpD
MPPIDAIAANAPPQGPTVEEAVSASEAEGMDAAVTVVEPEAPYFTYIVQQGDTVAAIAQRYGLEIESILWNNPDVNNNPDMLLIGQELVIPSRDGILYTLKLGDTLLDIAETYHAEVEDIVGFAFNEIDDPDSVREGTLVLLPGAVPPPPPPPAVTPEPVFVTDTSEDVAPTGGFTPAPSVPTVSGFIWPAVGNISEYYGAPRGGGTYHPGLDIDLYGRYGSSIVAAAPGQVVLASFGGYGYGYHVVIRHDNGYETLYAHMSDIYVTEGQWVSQGEAIGAAGCTGYCTGTHLHFEVKLNGAALNPLDYLP